MHTDPAARCDHSVAAVLITDPGDRLLLLERANRPRGFAPPAGHVFDHDGADRVDYEPAFLNAAVNEVREETALTVDSRRLRLVLDRWAPNRCSRPLAASEKAGHAWRVFETSDYHGMPRTTAEALTVRWYGAADVERLAAYTASVIADGYDDTALAAGPGLEPIWVWWLHELGRLPNITQAQAMACARHTERPPS